MPPVQCLAELQLQWQLSGPAGPDGSVARAAAQGLSVATSTGAVAGAEALSSHPGVL